MRNVQKNIFLIVPCFNEAGRLRERLKDFLNSPYRFIFVNDGSNDGTKELLENNIAAPDYFITLGKNSGKAEAVRSGMKFLMSLKEFEGVEWAGFWDADLATPLTEVSAFLDYAKHYTEIDAVYGSRVMRLGSVIKRDFFRHILGRIYCTVVSLLFGIGCYDTQCGAKLFSKKTLTEAFNEPFLSKWVFDVEIMLRLKSFNQLECPLRKWEDVKGSKISPFKSFAAVGTDIWKIYNKYR